MSLDPADPEAVNNYVKLLMSQPDGWRKVAAVMISPIRRALKDLYEIDMTKDQEVVVEAEVYRQHILKTGDFGYKEAIRLQDKLVDEFKGDSRMIPYERD